MFRIRFPSILHLTTLFLHRVVLFSMALKPIWQGTVMKGDLTNDLKLDVTITVDFCIKDITLEMCLFYYMYISEKPDCCWASDHLLKLHLFPHYVYVTAQLHLIYDIKYNFTSIWLFYITGHLILCHRHNFSSYPTPSNYHYMRINNPEDEHMMW